MDNEHKNWTEACNF